MYCRKCGAEISLEAKFCRKCGYPTKEKDSNAAPVETIIAPKTEDIGTIENTVPEKTEDIGTVENAAAEMTEDIGTVENTVPEKTEDIGTVENAAAEMTEDIGTAENAAAEMTEDIGTAENAAAEMTEDIGKAENAAAEITEDIGTAENAAAEMTEDIGTAENAAAEMTEDITKTENAAAEQFSSVSYQGNNENTNSTAASAANPRPKSVLSYAVICLLLLVCLAVPIAAGFYLFPEIITPALIKNSADSKFANKEYGNAKMLYNISDNSKNALKSEYKQAERLIDESKYSEACAILISLKNAGYDDDDGLLEQALNERCNELIKSGGYNYAIFNAEMMSDQNNKKAILNDIYIYKAVKMSNDQKYEEAYQLIEKVDKSAAYDSEKYNITVYNYAVSLYNDSNFTDACDVFETISDYGDAESLGKAAAYNAANEFLNDRDYKNALAYYEKSGNQGESRENIRICYYNLGVDNYNSGHYEDAKNYFSKASGYEDSAQYIRKCDDKLKYSGWYVNDVHLCTDYYESSDGEIYPVGETTVFSTYDKFMIIFSLENIDRNKSSYVDLSITFHSPSGVSDTATMYDSYAGVQIWSYWEFEYPQYATTGSAYFTVSIKDTGEELGTYYFNIY